MTEIPPWDPTGSGPHSVATQIEFCRPPPLTIAQAAVVDPSHEPRLASLAFLYIVGHTADAVWPRRCGIPPRLSPAWAKHGRSTSR
jgi:hypothetical protein